MKTLIIPCAGKSSRFPNMKPKYMLTYPDGKLMIQKAIEGMCLDDFDRVIITIVKDHVEEFHSDVVLRQAFKDNDKVELLILDDFTSSQSETIALTLKRLNIKGEFVVKDADNFVKIDKLDSNAIVGINIESFKKEVNRLNAKSFLIVNEQKNILDIIEKKVKSQYICIGVYCFSNADQFLEAYQILKDNNVNLREIYVSHVISYLIGSKKCVFKYLEADEYEDWGTLEDWRIVQMQHAVYIINLDGVLIKNSSRFGKKNWDSDFEIIEENVGRVRDIYNQGAQIIVTSTRSECYRDKILEFLRNNGIFAHDLILECNYAPQILINDFTPSNRYPSCSAINIPRNGNLTEFLPNGK